MYRILFVLVAFLLFFQANEIAASQLPLPRFASLKSDEINVRTGPGLRYRIKWVFIKQGMPVEIIAEFNQWRKIRDIEGEEGWVHQTMLSGRRKVLVNTGKTVPLQDAPQPDSKPVAYLEPTVIADLEKCQDEWCKLEVKDFNGWLRQANLWGVYTNEKVE